MTPLILGAGSVGIGLASFLANDFCQPVLIGRPQTTVLIAERGITRNGVFGQRSVAAHQIRVANDLADIHDVHPDVVCICVKTFDNDPVAAQLSAWPAVAEKPAPIILFQNGWGGTIPFETRFGKEQLFSARVITGFTRPVPNQVTITVHADAIHMGSIYGAVTEPLVELMNALNDGGMPTQIVADIASDLWAKLFYNNALNSLGAILDVSYGALGDSAMTRPIMEDVTREGFVVMTALGYKTHWPDAEAFLRAFYAHMLPPTAAHISSTLQDIHRGTRTEIDYLNGAIVREGLRVGIPTPVNTTLYHLVRFLEAKKDLIQTHSD